MRLRTSKRCRSITWWGIFACALLLVGTYVVFDLLDLDGSRMSRVPARDMMIGNTPETATERSLRTDLASTFPRDLLAPPLTYQASTEASRRIFWPPSPSRASGRVALSLA